MACRIFLSYRGTLMNHPPLKTKPSTKADGAKKRFEFFNFGQFVLIILEPHPIEFYHKIIM
jgi:hypothetical protein